VELYYALEAGISVPRRGRPIVTPYLRRRVAPISRSPHSDFGDKTSRVWPSGSSGGSDSDFHLCRQRSRDPRQRNASSLPLQDRSGWIPLQGGRLLHEGFRFLTKADRPLFPFGCDGLAREERFPFPVERKDRGIDFKDCSRRLAIAWSGQRRESASVSFLRDWRSRQRRTR